MTSQPNVKDLREIEEYLKSKEVKLVRPHRQMGYTTYFHMDDLMKLIGLDKKAKITYTL